jgi:hypothetical protein
LIIECSGFTRKYGSSVGTIYICFLQIHINSHIITHQNPPKLHNNHTNWEAFRTQIENNLRLDIPLKRAKDIEEAIAEFTDVIQKTAWSATLDDKPQTKYTEYPWVVKDQIKEKRKLRRRWQMSRHPEEKHIYNEAARKLKDQIKRIKEETFRTHLQSLTVCLNMSLTRVEAGSNTSTVALRDVVGDEKGTQCLGV